MQATMRKLTLLGLLALVAAVVVPASVAAASTGAVPALPAHAERAVCGPPAAHTAACHAHVVTKPNSATPLATTSYANGFRPDQLQTAYALGAASGVPGSGPTVAIV